MKRTLLLTIIALFSLGTNAQDMSASENTKPDFTTYKNSLSLGFLGAGELYNNIQVMPSLGYKRYLKDGAIRVLVGGTINSNSYSDGVSGYSSQTGAFSARVGYQYRVMLGRFMPLLGCDAVGGYRREESSPGGGTANNLNEVKLFGLSPNAGITLWISPKINMTLDTRFDLSYTESHSSYTYTDWWTGAPITTVTNISGLNTHISPISSFTVGFQF